MTTRRPRHARTPAALLSLCALCAVLLSQAGCQSGNTKAQWREEANNRWLDARTAIMLDMAEHQFATGDLDQAEKTVREALRIDQRSAPLTTLAGRVMLERGRLEKAFHFFTRAVELKPDHAPAHYYRGLVLQRWQRYDDARQSYQAAYDAQPDHLPHLLALAEMDVAVGQTRHGIDRLSGKLNYFDQSASLRAAIGELYELQGRPDLALPHRREAVLLDPDDPQLREALALNLVDAGQYREAIDELEPLLKQADFADRRDLRIALAEAYRASDKLEPARRCYLDLTRRDDATADDWLRLAELSWQIGDDGATLSAAGRAIRLEPRQYEAHMLAALVWEQRDDHARAAELFDKAANLQPDRPEPWILLALSLQREGRTGPALHAARRAIEADPDDTRARALLQRLQAPA